MSRRDPADLDDIDRKIIEELQRDGRKVLTKIGVVVELSEAAVRVRVQRMIGAGALQVVGVADPRAFGLSCRALIGIKVVGDTVKVADSVANLSAVVHVVSTAGVYDLILEVIAEDGESLIELLNTEIRPLKGVHSTETFIYLHTHKETHLWGNSDLSTTSG